MRVGLPADILQAEEKDSRKGSCRWVSTLHYPSRTRACQRESSSRIKEKPNLDQPRSNSRTRSAGNNTLARMDIKPDGYNLPRQPSTHVIIPSPNAYLNNRRKPNYHETNRKPGRRTAQPRRRQGTVPEKKVWEDPSERTRNE